MPLRLLQSGHGPRRPLVVIFHLTAELDTAVRAALGPVPIIVNVTEPPGQGRYAAVGRQGGQLMGLDELWVRLIPLLPTNPGDWTPEGLAVVGFSEGCQALRAWSRDGITPDVVVAIDGTHANKVPEPWQVDTWRRLWSNAAANPTPGTVPLFVATHSGIRTDLIPNPYTTTRALLSLVTGRELPAGGLKDAVVTREGAAEVWSYSGTDAPAHVRQARDVLPLVLRERVRPALAALAGGVTGGAVAGLPASVGAGALPAPVPAPPVLPPAPEELPAELTPASPERVGAALAWAWRTALGVAPSKDSIALLLAHWALETGRGKAMWCWNFGNAKSVDGDGRDFCFFACNELLTPAAGASSVANAKPRTDGKPGLNAAHTSTRKDGTWVVWFYPSHRWCRFRAFRSIEEGAADYLDLLRKRFASSWPYIVAADPAGYAAALKRARYYTADEGEYRAAVTSLFREFQRLSFDVADAPVEEPSAPAPVAAVNVDAVLAMTWMTMQRSIREGIESEGGWRTADPDGEDVYAGLA